MYQTDDIEWFFCGVNFIQWRTHRMTQCSTWTSRDSAKYKDSFQLEEAPNCTIHLDVRRQYHHGGEWRDINTVEWNRRSRHCRRDGFHPGGTLLHDGSSFEESSTCCSLRVTLLILMACLRKTSLDALHEWCHDVFLQVLLSKLLETWFEAKMQTRICSRSVGYSYMKPFILD